MTKKTDVAKTITINAADLAKYLAKAKATNIKKAKAYQLPVKAHTSTHAKLAIGVAVLQGTVALTLITAAIVHKVAYKKNADYRSKVDQKSEKVDLWVEDAKEEVAEKTEVATAKVAAAAKTARAKKDDLLENK